MYRRAAFVMAVALAAAAPARADALADVRSSGALAWGADQEGGGPYVYPRDDDPSQVTGFEVEIAGALARRMGVRPVFVQGQWDRMPELLRAGRCDVVLNGYEWSAARADAMEASIPYCAYGLQLLVRQDEASIATLDDLKLARAGRKSRLGVLTGSSAQDHARSVLGDSVEIVGYDGNTDAMREVETGKLDATLQDTPIAIFYGPRFPGLRAVGAPVAPGHYVVYARRGETALIREVDAALAGMIRDGELERILRRYQLWSPEQAELAHIADAGRFFGLRATDASSPTASGDATVDAPVVRASARRHGWAVVRAYSGILVAAAGVTVVLAVLSFPLAIGAGLLIALGRLWGPGWLKPFLTAWVEFLRGTPLMLQLFFIFFFLPEVGIVVPAFWTAILGLAVNYSAYESEIYRAGLQAIPPGQMEAALSLGMSKAMALRRIVVPQAARIVIPPVMNDFIALFKDTSVCSVVTLVELTKRFSVLSQSTQSTFELMLMTAALYLLMSYPLSLASRALERRLDAGGARP